jgi:hypothetical protein
MEVLSLLALAFIMTINLKRKKEKEGKIAPD